MRGWLGGPRDERGFTLLELMIVIVVLGILAGIVLFRVGGFRSEAMSSACATDVRTLATANAAYVVRHGDDAPSIQALIDDDYIKEAPKSGVTFADGHTNPASAAACTELAFTDPEDPGDGGDGGSGGSGGDGGDTPTPVTVGLAAAAGTTHRDGHSDDWTATVTVTVKDSNGDPVAGATVSGAWTDGHSDSGCTTGAGGSCTFTSGHTSHTPSQQDDQVWTLSSVTASGASMGTNSVSSLTCNRVGTPDGDGTCS